MLEIKLPSIIERIRKQTPTSIVIGEEEISLVAFLDAEDLARFMGHKAAKNKSGESREIGGAVKVKVTKRRIIWKREESIARNQSGKETDKC